MSSLKPSDEESLRTGFLQDYEFVISNSDKEDDIDDETDHVPCDKITKAEADVNYNRAGELMHVPVDKIPFTIKSSIKVIYVYVHYSTPKTHISPVVTYLFLFVYF